MQHEYAPSTLQPAQLQGCCEIGYILWWVPGYARVRFKQPGLVLRYPPEHIPHTKHALEQLYFVYGVYCFWCQPLVLVRLRVRDTDRVQARKRKTLKSVHMHYRADCSLKRASPGCTVLEARLRASRQAPHAFPPHKRCRVAFSVSDCCVCGISSYILP